MGSLCLSYMAVDSYIIYIRTLPYNMSFNLVIYYLFVYIECNH